MLAAGVEARRRLGDHDFSLDAVEARGDVAAATFSWTAADGTRATWAQALTLRDGQIVAIQDFADPSKALASVGR